jgi:hypothetical protein
MKGSIQKRGDAWRIVVDAGTNPSTGKRRQVVRTVRGTKREAQDVLNTLLVETGRGVHHGDQATLRELLDAWLAQAQLSPSTALDYRRAVASHLPAALLGEKVWRIRTHQLDKLYST